MMEMIKFITCSAVVLHEGYKSGVGFEGYKSSIQHEVFDKPIGDSYIDCLSLLIIHYILLISYLILLYISIFLS